MRSPRFTPGTPACSPLASSLDTEAGLADILPQQAAAQPAAPQPPGMTAAEAIAAADPAVRMALRRSPVTLAVILSDLTVRALLIANEALTARDSTVALGLARDVARDLPFARALARDVDLAHDVARDVDLVRDLTPARALGLALDLARALGLALVLDADPARDVGLARRRVRALVLDIDVALGLAHDVDLARDLTLARALTLALGVVHQTAMAVGRALGVQQVKGFAAALLEGALDDFTRADLAHADLTGRDLTGVRWADWSTRWPPETDVDELRARSREVAPDTGVYVIVSPGDSDKALHRALS